MTRVYKTSSVNTLFYSGIFAVSYLAALLILNFVMLKIGSSSGLNIGITVLCIFITVYSFVSREHRQPSKAERRRLTWGTLLSSYIVSGLCTYIVFARAGYNPAEEFNYLVERVTPVLLGGAAIIVTLLYYAVIGLFYLLLGKVSEKTYRQSQA